MRKIALLASFLVSFLAVGIAFSALAQEDGDIILYSQEGDWPVYKQLANSPEDLESCFTYHEQSATDFIYFLLMDGGTTLMIQRDDWQLPANIFYPVFLQIDNNDPIEATINTLDTSDAVMIDEDITSILEEIKAGRRLYLHTESTTFQYDLTGASQAISATQACLREVLDVAPENPFLAGQAGGGSNPFEAPQSEQSFSAIQPSGYLLDPFLELDSYQNLFVDFTDFGFQVEVGPSSFDIGTYQALIEEAYYTLYWEEDSSTRETSTVFADVFTFFNEICKDMATTKLVEETRTNHVFHQGSVACSNEAEEISLFFRLSIFDMYDVAMIFLSTGTLEDREAIEIIDDILVENVTLVFEITDE
ncbi:MAG: hypothetical protein IH995_03140 [Proteobacteria bacterium]|nr:hypothetical protein [Pseudomonadota bacterium]